MILRAMHFVGAMLMLAVIFGASMSGDAKAAASPADAGPALAAVAFVAPDHGPCAGCCSESLNAPCGAESLTRQGSTPVAFATDHAVDRPEDSRLPDSVFLKRILRPPKS